MATLNWNDFLADERLTLPNEQWSDFQQTTFDPLPEMPKPSTGRKNSVGIDGLTGFDSFLNSTNFDDSLFTTNNYFLSDSEVLQPFGDTLAGGESTSESSPEPTSAIARTGPFTVRTESSSQTPASTSTSTGQDQSPLMATQQRPSVQRSQTFPNPAYESLFPNNMDSGFVEDLTFPDGPIGAMLSQKSTIDKDAQPSTTSKRTKAKPDIISACWTSPLCPNHDQDGPPPNPSNCGGGCAPFLFASEDTLPTPTMNSLLPQPQEVTAEDGVVEIQPRSRKRSESDASSEPSGRQFSNPTIPEVMRVKSESLSQASPEEIEPTVEDNKPKSRRRLPHNQVERKYRESLNTQLESLRRVVPALQQNPPGCGADIEDLPTPSKPSKAVILASATAYIKQMEKDKKTLAEENQILRTRMKALTALVKCEDCSLMQYVMDLKINQQK